MARVVRIISDLSGADNAEEVQFHVDGKKYTIALTPREAYNFRQTYEASKRRLSKYVEAAQLAEEKEAKSSLSVAFHVRNWAKSKGYDVPVRGRIPEWVMDSWRRAGSPMSAEM